MKLKNSRHNLVGATLASPAVAPGIRIQVTRRLRARQASPLPALVAIVGISISSLALADEPAGNMQNTTTKTVEQYVPQHRTPVASLEIHPEITSNGNEVTLKQICQWPEGDAEMMAEFADLVVMRFDASAQYATVTLDQVQALLRDAGMNPASVNFAGAGSCRVIRGDAKVDEAEALRDWATGQPAMADGNAKPAPNNPDRGQAKGDAPAAEAAKPEVGDLRAQLINSLATSLNLSPDTMQVEFSPEDQKLLMMSDPRSFSIEPQRAGDLGSVSWLVTVSNGGESKRVRIAAKARAWLDQVVCARPLGMRQTICETDIETRRVLADKMPGDVLVTREQVIGQQAARDLKIGTVFTGKMLAPVELVRAGQLVTVLMRRGAIEVKSVARALQSGSAGQQVKVKNEATGDMFEVTLIGRQLATLSGSDPVADAGN